jgi:hypothetical protein
MPFPPEAPFNPKVSAVPSLDSTSGNPAAYKDPKSVASMGLKLQAMSDQASADTLYDPPPPPRKAVEGFQVQNLYKRGPWITQTEACKKPDSYRFDEEGFQDFRGYHESSGESGTKQLILFAVAACTAGLLVCTFVQRK